MGEKGRVFGAWLLYAFFECCGIRDSKVFGNKEQSVHMLKWLLLSNLLVWVGMFINEVLIPSIDFVD